VSGVDPSPIGVKRGKGPSFSPLTRERGKREKAEYQEKAQQCYLEPRGGEVWLDSKREGCQSLQSFKRGGKGGGKEETQPGKKGGSLCARGVGGSPLGRGIEKRRGVKEEVERKRHVISTQWRKKRKISL